LPSAILIARLFRLAGAYVRIEYRPIDGVRTRPDLLVVFPDFILLIDVVVSHPSAPSRISLEPLAATRRAEKVKVAKYGHIAQAYGARIMAFAVESYGAFGAHATEIVKLIRRELAHSPELRDDTLHALLPQYLAVCLQKGNALVARVGSLRARQAALRLE